MKVKAGTDRNIEGTKIYGKGWLDAAGTLRMTREAMEEAKEKADALGLTIGTEQTDAIKKYRDAQVEAHDVMEALGKVIASAVLPVLTSMGSWLASIGPQAVGVMRVAIDILSTAFEEVWTTVKAVAVGLWDALARIGTAILSVFGADSEATTAMEFFKKVLQGVSLVFVAVGTVVQVAVEALLDTIERFTGGLMRLTHTAGAIWDVLAGNGKWSDVVAAWDRGTKAIEDKAREHEDNMGRIVQKGIDDVDKALSDQAGKAPTVTATADDDSGSGATTAEKMAKLMAELNAELAAKKAAWDEEQAAHGTFLAFSLAQERQFWEDNASRAAEGSTERLEIERNANKLKSAIAKEDYKAQLDALKAAEGAYKNNLEAKLAVAVEMANKIAVAEGASSPAAAKAGAEVLAITRELVAQRLAVEQDLRQELRRFRAVQGGRRPARSGTGQSVG